MPTTISSREFNQDTSRAKKAASNGPVFITDRGRPAHVLLTYADYKKLSGTRTNIADLLAMPDLGDQEFVAPSSSELARPADLT